MRLFILGLGKIIKDMEMEHFSIKMKGAFKGDGMLMKRKVLDDCIIRMEIFIKAIIKIVNQMVKVNMFAKVLDKNLLGCLLMINTKAKENSFGKMVLHLKECLKMG